MLKIFVCEDDIKQRKNIVDIIKKYIMMRDYDLKFELETESPTVLLDYISKMEKDATGLYFLDVDLHTKMNGIMLGAEIRKYDPNARIVYVTTHTELAYLTFLYKVEAMEYIPKDNKVQLEEKLIECVDVAMERYLNVRPNSLDNIIIKSGDSQIKLGIREIQFIESSSTPHRLIVHLDNRQVEFYGKIKDIEALHSNFYRCHQSYVVNVLNIESINARLREIKMKDGEVCYSSVRYLRGLLAKFEHIKNNK
jgi:Response regulator of the LytR/AlgR family